MNLYGAVIRNDGNMDVCYEVVKSFDVGHKLKLKVQCVNMAYVSSYPMNIALNIEIDKKDIANWSRCDDTSVKCLRNTSWSRLV